MVNCWLMLEEPEHPREECHRQPKVFVSLDKLASIGVLYFKIPLSDKENGLSKISAERKYAHRDEVVVGRDKLPNYDEKLKAFFEEHLHKDEEVRYVLEGDGYFDVRDEENCWIRIHVEQGDLIVIPAGIYHRFTLTTTDFIHVIRLFKEEPSWTPFNRGEEADNLQERLDYLASATIKA